MLASENFILQAPSDTSALVFETLFDAAKHRKGVPRPVYSTFWNYNPNTRSLVFLMPKLKGVNVRRIVDVVQEEKAFGLRPLTEEEKRAKAALEQGN